MSNNKWRDIFFPYPSVACRLFANKHDETLQKNKKSPKVNVARVVKENGH